MRNKDVFRNIALRTKDPLLMSFYAADRLVGEVVAPAHPAEMLRPRKCDCHVLGGNTLGTSGIGTASLAGRFATLPIDAGDSTFFKPYYIFIAGYQVSGVAPTLQVQGDELPLLLQNAKTGQTSNLRRASDTDPSFGIITTAYGDQKEIECLDWHKFSSINNQQLTLTFYNPNDVTVHAFVDLWGIPVPH